MYISSIIFIELKPQLIMDNQFNNKPMYTDDLFPKNMGPFPLNGIVYSVSSKPVVEGILPSFGSLVLLAKEVIVDAEESDEQQECLMYFMCVCLSVDDGMATLQTQEGNITVEPLNMCRLLKVAIPVFPSEPPYSIIVTSFYN